MMMPGGDTDKDLNEREEFTVNEKRMIRPDPTFGIGEVPTNIDYESTSQSVNKALLNKGQVIQREDPLDEDDDFWYGSG